MLKLVQGSKAMAMLTALAVLAACASVVSAGFYSFEVKNPAVSYELPDGDVKGAIGNVSFPVNAQGERVRVAFRCVIVCDCVCVCLCVCLCLSVSVSVSVSVSASVSVFVCGHLILSRSLYMHVLPCSSMNARLRLLVCFLCIQPGLHMSR